jgi:hypothetical protein
MDTVAGQVMASQPLCHLPDLFLRLIAPSGLVIPQGPELLHGSPPGQPGIVGDYGFQAVPCHKIVVQVSLLCSEHIIVFALLSQVKEGFTVIVKENAVSALFLQHKHKRNTLVKRLEIVLMGIGNIRIPHHILVMSLV